MYADDVIIFAAPTVGEAQALATILSIFGDATGLRTNLAKCSIAPIYGAEEIMARIQAVLPCQISEFPITYLEVPLSTSAIPRSFFRPLVDKVARRLPTWKGPMIPKSGMLVLTKGVLSTIPTYMLMADQLPGGRLMELIAYDESSCGSDTIRQ
jgi:hypothetical protein